MSREHRIFIDLPPFHFDPKIEEQNLHPPKTVKLDAETSHYLHRVLRLKVGDNVTAIDREKSYRFLATLESASSSKGSITLFRFLNAGDPPASVQTLFIAHCKGKKTDLICEKAAELGVAEIVIWQADRSVPQVESAQDAAKKTARWNKIAESACLQCNRNSVPKINFMNNINELGSFLSETHQGQTMRLCCSLTKEAKALRELEPPRGPIHLLIGPEGDISDREYQVLKDLNFQMVSLGPHVLRAETAAIAAVSSAQALWGAFR